MRYLFIALWMVFLSAASAVAQVSVTIGVNVPVYPELSRVPGYASTTSSDARDRRTASP